MTTETPRRTASASSLRSPPSLGPFPAETEENLSFFAPPALHILPPSFASVTIVPRSEEDLLDSSTGNAHRDHPLSFGDSFSSPPPPQLADGYCGGAPPFLRSADESATGLTSPSESQSQQNSLVRSGSNAFATGGIASGGSFRRTPATAASTAALLAPHKRLSLDCESLSSRRGVAASQSTPALNSPSNDSIVSIRPFKSVKISASAGGSGSLGVNPHLSRGAQRGRPDAFEVGCLSGVLLLGSLLLVYGALLRVAPEFLRTNVSAAALEHQWHVTGVVLLVCAALLRAAVVRRRARLHAGALRLLGGTPKSGSAASQDDEMSERSGVSRTSTRHSARQRRQILVTSPSRDAAAPPSLV